MTYLCVDHSCLALGGNKRSAVMADAAECALAGCGPTRQGFAL